MTSKSKIKVISYYTINTPYELEVENLKKSIKTLNIDSDIIGVPNLGSWEANTHFKANFIESQLNRYDDGDKIMFVDSDAVFRRYPVEAEDFDFDLGVRFENFYGKSTECLSGTIFMKNSEKIRKTISDWISLNASTPCVRSKPETWEQSNLNKVLELNKHGLKIENLPASYTYIFDTSKRKHPDVNPVIEHFQASRRFYRKISA